MGTEIISTQVDSSSLITLAADVPATQTAVVIVLTPDMAVLEGAGTVGVNFKVMQSDTIDTFMLGAVDVRFQVKNGVLYQVFTDRRTPKPLADKAGNALTSFKWTFLEEIRRADLTDRWGTVYDYDLDGQIYKRYALLPKMWIEAEHYAVNNKGISQTRTLPYSLAVSTDARRFSA